MVGSALRPSRMAIRALGQGKEVSFSVHQFLTGAEARGEPFLFNSRFGKLLEEAQSRKLLELEHDEKSGGYIIKSFNPEE